MFLGALSGFTVGVTADRRAEEQTELLARRGAEVVSGPVIRTLPLSDEQPLTEATTALVAEPPDHVVLSTALGVRAWYSSAEGLGLLDPLRAVLRDATVIARGPKAAGAALTYGLDVDWVTPNATYAEVVDHLAVRRPAEGERPRRVALQLDGERSSGLADALRDLGYEVVPVPVYEWHLPDDLGPAERLVAAAAERAVDAITFTSAHAVTNFGHIAESSGRLGAVVEAAAAGALSIVCVGPVTAARARSFGFDTCVEPAHPRLGAMVQALVVAFTDRTVAVDLQGIQVLLQGRLVSADGGPPIRLTDRERALLEALARRPGAVVSKRSLLNEVWAGESDDHVVEVTVARLRRRLGAAGGGIETVVRRGYRLAAS
ncbi:uroporphyrinogen-III synthase [Dermatobacter hominis]|uniref:uroporphyrinogen-III synthase n=1 Tax=Dermatobacter hominis TaxID=2884263 RepID=UPI001D11AA9C|nr:uroporphyrinogen-III synthase [Dermatobacter hominis]UDY35152.1 uroporphyrinogen-III synthase [Dermatobacter hominis]